MIMKNSINGLTAVQDAVRNATLVLETSELRDTEKGNEIIALLNAADSDLDTLINAKWYKTATDYMIDSVSNSHSARELERMGFDRRIYTGKGVNDDEF